MNLFRKNNIQEESLRKELWLTKKKLDECISGKINLQSENVTHYEEDQLTFAKRRRLIFLSSVMAVIALSIINISGWIFDITLFKSVRSDWSPMRPLTSVCFFISAISLVLISLINSRKTRSLAKASAIAVTLVGVVMTLSYLIIYLADKENISYLFMKFFLDFRMALITALLFTITGTILLKISYNKPETGNLVKGLSILSLMVCYYIPVSYIIGFRSIFSILDLSISFYASLAFCALVLGFLSLNNDSWVIKLFASNLTGSTMARRILPGILVAPPIIGVLIIKGFERGVLNYHALVVFVSVTYSLVLIWLLWLAANSVNKIDENKKLLTHSLRQSEERYRQLVEAANSIIVRWDINGDLKFVNNYTLSFFGYSQEEMLGKNIMMIIPNKEKSGRDLSNLVNEIIAEPEKFAQSENENIKKNGERVWISWANRAITDNNGKVVEILAVGNDITRLKKTEEALKFEHDKLKGIIENMAVGVIVFDREGNVTTFNKAALKIHDFNYDEEMLSIVEKYGNYFELKQTSGDILPIEEWPVYRTFRGEFARDFKVLLSNRKTGSTKYINYNSIPVYDSQNRSMFAIINMVDYTSTQMLTEAILDSEQRYSSLFNNSTLGIMHARLIVDENGKPVDYVYLQVNDAFTRLTGFTKDQVIGKKGKEIYEGLENLPVNIIEAFGKTALNNIESNFEIYFENLKKWFSIYAYSSKKGEFTAMFNDITERKRIEEEARSNATEIEAILNCIADSVIVYDKQGEIIRSNPAANNLFKTDNNKSLIERIKNNKVWTEDRHSLSPEEMPAYRAAINGETIENLVVRQELFGKEYWFNISASPLVINGKPTGAVLSASDITQRKKSEEILARERELLVGILDNIPVMLTIYDPQMKDFRFNNYFKHVLGWKEKDAVEGDIMTKVYPDASYRKKVSEYMQSLQPGWKEWQMTAKDGSLVDTEWANIILSSNTQIGIGIDIRERKKSEEKIRKNEQRLQGMFNNAAIGIVETDSEEHFIDVNDKMCEILGYSRDELIGKTVYDITSEDFRQISLTLNTKLHKGGTTVIDYEKKYIKKDGNSIWVHITVSAVRDSNGNYTNSVGTIEDITERKMYEEALLKSETILKQAGTMANLGAWEIEFINDEDQNKNPLTWSEQVYRIFGYEPYSVEVTNELFFYHVHPDDKKKISEALDKAIKDRSSYNIEHRIIRADNVERIVIEHAEIKFDKSWKPLQIIGAVQDITERKNAEATVKESEEKFRSLFENITEGVVLHEIVYEGDNIVNYKVIDLNPAFEELTGISRQSAVGQLATDLYLSKGLPPYIDEYSEVAISRKKYKFEAYFSDLKKHFIINVISPKKGFFATVYEDITDQKAIEHEILMKNEELTRFIYTVSHDLKSPLVTIKMFTTYLRLDIEKNDKASQDSDLKYIENAADKMSRLLDELLELSRIGRKEQLKTEVSLQEIAQTAVDLVAGRISERKVKVLMTAPPIMLYGYSQRFIQLYQNLIDNAVKFMGQQKDPVIEIGAFINENNEIILYIRDNGSGIDPRHQHKLFGLFEKLDPTSEGTGIGLALVKRIVEVHGGKIWFESEGPGKGTTFYFILEKAKILQEDKV